LVDRGLISFNQRQLSRVYPQASRLTSANFNPISMWNSGCHMVALNFQTGDKSMQLNSARFAANGRYIIPSFEFLSHFASRCGYVLKPQYLMDETFRADSQQQRGPTQSNASSTIPNLKCLFCRLLIKNPSLAKKESFSRLLTGIIYPYI
jgi:hypothetical protein